MGNGTAHVVLMHSNQMKVARVVTQCNVSHALFNSTLLHIKPPLALLPQSQPRITAPIAIFEHCRNQAQLKPLCQLHQRWKHTTSPQSRSQQRKKSPQPPHSGAPQVLWLQLVDSAGQPHQGATVTSVSLPQGSMVDQFRDAVKAKFADSLLSGIASSVLPVYGSRSAFDGRGADGGGQPPLRASQAVEGLGAREDDAVVVVVPLAVTPDLPMTVFAQRCLELSKTALAARSVLEFPDGVLDMRNSINTEQRSIFVRDCYEPLFDWCCRELLLSDQRHSSEMAPRNASEPSGSAPVVGSFSHGPPVQHPLNVKHRAKVFVLGTPGVGKSMFRTYVFIRLLAIARTLTNKQKYIFVFQKHGIDAMVAVYTLAQDSLQCYTFPHGLDLGKFCQRFQADESIVVSLADVSYGLWRSSIQPRIEWLFSSPNAKLLNDSEIAKECIRTMACMPLWSLEELQYARAKLGLRATLLDAEREFLEMGVDTTTEEGVVTLRYCLYGGSIRRVLSKPEDAVLQLQEVLSSYSEDHRKISDNADRDIVATVRDRIAVRDLADEYWKAGVPNFSWWKARNRACSRYVASRFALAVLISMDDSFNAIFLRNGIPSVIGFEAECLLLARLMMSARVPAGSNVWLLRHLPARGCSVTTPMTEQLQRCINTFPGKLSLEIMPHAMLCTRLAALLERQATADDATAGPCVLLLPLEWNAPAIDGILVSRVVESGRWIPCVFLLQATISQRHPVNGAKSLRFLNELVAACAEKSAICGLVFLVPYHLYDSFQHQTIEDADLSQRTPQYALSLGQHQAIHATPSASSTTGATST